MKPAYILILVGLVLAGCANAPDLPKNYTLDIDHPEGLVVVSLTLSGMPLRQVTSFEYRIREVPPPDEQAVTTKHRFGSAAQSARWVANGEGKQDSIRNVIVKGPNSAEPLDVFDDGKPIGRLTTLRLPAGEYEFRSWKVSEPTPYGELEYTPKQVFSYRFRVKPSMTSYIGRLNLRLKGQKTQKIDHSDRQREDLAVFKKKYPQLSQGEIVVCIMSN